MTSQTIELRERLVAPVLGTHKAFPAGERGQRYFSNVSYPRDPLCSRNSTMVFHDVQSPLPLRLEGRLVRTSVHVASSRWLLVIMSVRREWTKRREWADQKGVRVDS